MIFFSWNFFGFWYNKKANICAAKGCAKFSLGEMLMKKTSGASAGRGQLIIFCLFGLMFFFSISATMTGLLISDITESYALTYGQAGWIGSVQSIGGFVATLLGGVLSDRFPKLRLICIMFAVYTLALYGLGFVPPYGLLIACFLILGMTNSLLNLLISAYISERCPEKRTSYLNLCHAFYGLGSLAGPVYASILLQTGIVWNHTFLWFGVFCTAVTLLLVFVCRTDKGGAQQGETKGSMRGLLKNRGLLLVSLACLLYMGQQSAVNLWIASYVETEMHSAEMASVALTLYWTGVMLGRFLQSALSRRVDSGRWLCVCCTVSAILFTAAVQIGNPVVLSAALCIGTILTGAAFPSMMAMGCACCPEQAGAATSVVCLGSSIGGMIFPPLVGWIAERTSFRTAIYVIPVVLVLCTVVLLFCVRKKTEKIA